MLRKINNVLLLLKNFNLCTLVLIFVCASIHGAETSIERLRFDTNCTLTGFTNGLARMHIPASVGPPSVLEFHASEKTNVLNCLLEFLFWKPDTNISWRVPIGKTNTDPAFVMVLFPPGTEKSMVVLSKRPCFPMDQEKARMAALLIADSKWLRNF